MGPIRGWRRPRGALVWHAYPRGRLERLRLIWQSFAACAKATGGRMLQLFDSAQGLSPMQRAEERMAGLLGLGTIVVTIEQLAALDSGPQDEKKPAKAASASLVNATSGSDASALQQALSGL